MQVEQKHHKKDVAKRYLDLRERALKYSNVDMNLKLENNEQVYLAVFDIPIESNLKGFHTQTLVLLFGLCTHLYHGSGGAITDLEKNIDIMRAMQSLLISSSQVLKTMKLTSHIEYYESNNIRAYLKTNCGTYFKELDLEKREDRFLNMLLENVLAEIAKDSKNV